MELKKGTIVCSAAGHDKGMFFVVLSANGQTVSLCNGKQRPLERPKAKNIKHICPTLHVLSEHSMKTNREIRRSLNTFSGLQD